MPTTSRSQHDQQKAQLNKAEREQLEDVVTEMRKRIEDNIRFQLTQKGLDEEPTNRDSLAEATEQLVAAIEAAVDDDVGWDEAVDQYVDGVGYTIVNRLAALRCMEVREFIDEEVTVFKADGLTPAAETLVHEEFLLEDEAILTAYHNTCDELAAEIEMLFDRSTAYSLLDPDTDTFEALCGMVDEVPDEVWRADDVLGWVYEYYNTSQLSGVRERMRTGKFDADDVAVANQFYTPYWVVRLLADNAIGKPYLAANGELADTIAQNRGLTTSQRIERDPEYDESPTVQDLCTYIIPSEDQTSFEATHPAELQILDPACGSGHFLLYGFDILERIWREMTDVSPGKIPEKILENNIYGMDIDMRACQLAAFNLYLKARQRAEAEGNTEFDIPEVGIVCADNQLADLDEARTVIETLAEDHRGFADSLEHVLEDFQEKKGLGSLLDVKETLKQMAPSEQTEITTWAEQIPSLSGWIQKLHAEIEKAEQDRFLYQNLQSFLRTIVFLTQEYDTILMNPPYGGRRRMPPDIQEYIKSHYSFKPEYYVNFIEQSSRLLKQDGSIGMLVPRSFMYKESFEDVRHELVDPDGAFDFDFLIESGQGVLDNATVRTVISVIGKNSVQQQSGEFIQLSDVEAGRKEETFVDQLSEESEQRWRTNTVDIEEFDKIPGSMLTYWAPEELRELYTSETVFDAELADLPRADIGSAKKGIATGKNDRFLRRKWECRDDHDWRPYAKGGQRCWFYYPNELRVLWDKQGAEIARFSSSAMRNIEYQGAEAVTWPLIKDSGHRFAKFNGGVSDDGGPCFYPDTVSIHTLTGLLNSTIYTGLLLAQTPERQWNLSDIAVLPYFDFPTATTQRLEQLATDISALVADFESFRPNAGRYEELLGTYESFEEFCEKRREKIQSLVASIREKQRSINRLVATALDVGSSTIEQIHREAELRYGTDEIMPYAVGDIPTETEAFCSRLLEYLVRSAVTGSDDGIVVTTTEFQAGTELYDRIEARIEAIFEAPASTVLSALDEHAGNKKTGAVPYPNIEHWIREEFFETHTTAFENTPIVWELTTSRLVSNLTGDGFRCLIDYHRIDAGLFDRLSNRYLEPRKADLRERRSAANRRRGDDSLSTGEHAKAVEAYETATSGLEQIAGFENVLQDLSATTNREFDEANRRLAETLAKKVDRFREETERRVAVLDTLYEMTGDEWFEDRFSPTFWSKVQELRHEWLATLTDLTEACEEYASPTTEPVEAHLADLFEYFTRRTKGSGHYSSSGILFMTYYFEREAEPFLNDDGQPNSGLQDEQAKGLAVLGGDLDEYKSLADEIEAGCTTLLEDLPNNWSDRARSEITTAGYQPNHKHGVAINISPLVDAEIVPESVDERVI
jgi:type I restriction-modification system DNA methylase subunit